MKAMQGYFDGNVCVPFEKTDFALNEKVLITPLKQQTKIAEIIDRFFGVLDDDSAKAAFEALEDCRRIDPNEWQPV